MKKILNKIFALPIFAKLILVFLFVGIILNSVLNFAFFRLVRSHARDHVPAILNYTLENILEDIGTPLDPQKAKQLSEDLSIHIYIQEKGQLWVDDQNFQHRVKEFLHHNQFRKKRNIYRFHREFFVRYEKGDVLLIASPRVQKDKQAQVIFIVVMIFTSIIVLTLSYVVVRRILLPLKGLEKGFQRVQSGDLETKLELKRKDEFGRLETAFNEMRSEIKLMLANKKQLISDVSHELRSPITRLKLLTTSIQEKGLQKDFEEEVLEMETLVKELLDVQYFDQKSYHLNLEEIEIGWLINQISSKFGEGKSRIQSLEIPKVKANIDPVKMEIAVGNIIENALKYSEDQIVISCSENPLRLQIKDRGIGIPAEHLNKITEPFYRVDPSRNKNSGGFGIGLNLAKKIIEAHGFSLRFESSASGTTVTIDFKV